MSVFTKRPGFAKDFTSDFVSEIAYVEQRIFDTYGDRVSVFQKAKSLNKFGLRESVGTSFETVAQIPDSNETFVSTNAITSVVSTSTSDTFTIAVEGHTIDLVGNLTFVIQQVTLTGQTPVLLTTPLARVNRLYVTPSGTFNSPQALPVGVVSVYEGTSGVSSGSPTVSSSVKIELNAGFSQSEKAATTISKDDYYIITQVEAGIGEAGGNSDRVLVQLQSRDVVNGGVWRPLGRNLTISTTQNGVQLNPKPYLICPKNHDIRLVARVDAGSTEVFGEFNGYLAKILT